MENCISEMRKFQMKHLFLFCQQEDSSVYKKISLEIETCKLLAWWSGKSSSLTLVSTTFLLVCFASRKESTCDARKNVFLFHVESYFCSWDNQFLIFQILKCYDVIRCPSIKWEALVYLIRRGMGGLDFWVGLILNRREKFKFLALLGDPSLNSLS